MIADLHASVARALPNEPVVMLNLMKFREHSLDGDGSGWDAYVRYSKMTNKLIKQHQGRIVWAGEVTGTTFGPVTHGDWDYTALVSYPTPAAFVAMIESDAYAESNVHRENGCVSHLIMSVTEMFNGLAPKA